MEINWNRKIFLNERYVEKLINSAIESNKDKFGKLIIEGMMKGSKDIAEFIIPMLLDDLYNKKMDAYNIATLIEATACKNNFKAMDVLLQCFVEDPHKCFVSLVNTILSYDKKNLKKIPPKIKFQIAFCYIFGIGVNIDHGKAIEYICNESDWKKCKENLILLRFLKKTTYSKSIRKTNIKSNNLSKSSIEIDDKDEYISTLSEFFYQLNNTDKEFHVLQMFINVKFNSVKVPKYIINLFKAYRASLEFKKCISNPYQNMSKFNKKYKIIHST